MIIFFCFPFFRSVNAYQNSYYYQYEQQNQEEDDGAREYDINNCKWWQWRCTPLYVNENGEYVNQDNNNNNEQNGNQYYSTPSWFSGWGNNSNQSGDRSGDGGVSNSAAMKFVYSWQVILFLGLLAYGALVVYKFRPSSGSSAGASRMALQSLFLMIFLWMNTTFMAMWMLANGSIAVEGREIEELGGFYNQFSVMMFLSDFWMTVWGLVFCGIIGVQLCRTPSRSTNISDARGSKNSLPGALGESMNYLPYTEPSVTVTGVENNRGALF